MSVDPFVMVFVPSLILLIFVRRRMAVLAEGLHPRLIDLELASTSRNVNLLLRTWTPADSALATRLLVLDYLRLIAYGASGASLTLLVAGAAARRGWWLSVAGDFMAMAFIVAAFCDAIENYLSLLMMASRRVGRALPLATTFFAVAKFALLGSALLYLVALFVRLEVAGLWWVLPFPRAR